MPNSKKLFISIAVLSLLILVSFGYITVARAVEYVGRQTLPSSALPDLDASPTQTTKIYDADGELLYEVGSVYRRTVRIDDVPEGVKAAFLAAEDRTFYTNPGFSIRSLVRAVSTDLRHDELRQGGSTITQQLAQMLMSSKESTLSRKFREIIVSAVLTQRYDKDTILERYLNEVPVGGELVGIGTAAELYFGKRVDELTPAQGAYIAALINAPGTLDPYLNPEGLQERQRLVLSMMAEFGFIDQQQRDGAVAEAVEFLPRKTVLRYPFFSLYVRQLLEKEFGQEVVNQGLIVHTSLKTEAQDEAEKLVAEQVKLNTQQWRASNAALISVDASSGQIVAYVGGSDFSQSQVDINSSRRQPGSTIKPLIYYSAFEQGFVPDTLVSNAAEDFGSGYRPLNYGGWSGTGYVSLRSALSSSLNIPAVRVLRGVGIPKATNALQRMGFPIDPTYDYTLPLALGAVEVTPLDMAQAYAVMANEGAYIKVSPLVKVTDSHGKVLLDRTGMEWDKQVLDAEAVSAATSIISDYTLKRSLYSGSYYRNYTLADRPAAAKTGTSSGPKDAWTIGYTPQYLTVVWTGNNSGADLLTSADGINVAAPIWHNMMTWLHEGLEVEKFPEYKRVRPTGDYVYIDRAPRGYVAPTPSPTPTEVMPSELYEP